MPPSGVDPDDVPEPDIDASRPVMAMGSYTLAKVAVARGWSPGAFLENTGYDDWHDKWPVLNPGAWTGPLRDARVTEPSFVRPLSDSKIFVGKVYDLPEFHEWQVSVADLGPESYVNGDTGARRPNTEGWPDGDAVLRRRREGRNSEPLQDRWASSLRGGARRETVLRGVRRG